MRTNSKVKFFSRGGDIQRPVRSFSEGGEPTLTEVMARMDKIEEALAKLVGMEAAEQTKQMSVAGDPPPAAPATVEVPGAAVEKPDGAAPIDPPQVIPSEITNVPLTDIMQQFSQAPQTSEKAQVKTLGVVNFDILG